MIEYKNVEREQIFWFVYNNETINGRVNNFFGGSCQMRFVFEGGLRYETFTFDQLFATEDELLETYL